MSRTRFSSAADIIAFAIQREIEAAEGYARIAAAAETPGLRELAEDLRLQEVEHRRLLEGLPAEPLRELAAPSVPDLQLVDALADEPPAPGMTLQDMLIFAAKKEARAAALYDSLAAQTSAAGHDRLFLFLAGQERGHKLKLEAAYESLVLAEN